MIAAIREMAENKPDYRVVHDLTADYLEACNLIFENGILSHNVIIDSNSICLKNISKGIDWFVKWKEELQENPGKLHYILDDVLKLYLN